MPEGSCDFRKISELAMAADEQYGSVTSDPSDTGEQISCTDYCGWYNCHIICGWSCPEHPHVYQSGRRNLSGSHRWKCGIWEPEYCISLKWEKNNKNGGRCRNTITVHFAMKHLLFHCVRKWFRREQLSICEAKGGLRMLQFARYQWTVTDCFWERDRSWTKSGKSFVLLYFFTELEIFLAR